MAPAKVGQDEEWSTKEVADYIGMSRQWVQNAAGAGIVPSYRLSERGRFHFKSQDIMAWHKQRLSMSRVAQ